MNFITIGVLGTLMVLGLSGALITTITDSADTDFFINWAGTFFMCATPFQIMMAVVWKHEYPNVLKKMSTPIEGLTLTLLFLLAGCIITPVLIFTVGQGSLTPILIHYIIQSVGLSLLVIIVFDCWPIRQFTSNPLLLGLGTLLYCYILDFILFSIFYDYSFMSSAPFYTESLNPNGLFNAITSLSFAVTAVAFVMVLIMFEMWPVPQIAKGGNQPLFGFIATLLILLLSGLTYYLFVELLKIEPMEYMVRGPVCIIFGAFIVDNMMQFQLFSTLKQPLKGAAKMLVCLVCAGAMYELYEWILPYIAGEDLPSGPSTGYAKEAWIATAMLGITFPIINIVSGAFKFWPIKRLS